MTIRLVACLAFSHLGLSHLGVICASRRWRAGMGRYCASLPTPHQWCCLNDAHVGRALYYLGSFNLLYKIRKIVFRKQIKLSSCLAPWMVKYLRKLQERSDSTGLVHRIRNRSCSFLGSFTIQAVGQQLSLICECGVEGNVGTETKHVFCIASSCLVLSESQKTWNCII